MRGKARELVRRNANWRRDDHGALGRIALHRPDALALRERCIVAAREGAARRVRATASRWGDASASITPSAVSRPPGCAAAADLRACRP